MLRLCLSIKLKEFVVLLLVFFIEVGSYKLPPSLWHNQADFLKMEGGVAYLPCYYDQSGEIIPAAYPLILGNDGKVDLLKPDTIHLHQKMIFTRIFPIIPDKFEVAGFGGCFQGANKSDFSDAEDLYIINKPIPFWNTAIMHTNKRFRYVRYLTAPGHHCSISELAFYSSKIKLAGNLIGTKEFYNNDSTRTIDKAVDNDLATHFESKYATGTWVGLDLKQQQRIDSIRFAAPCNETAATKIVSGNEYELFYWGANNTWVSKGKSIAKGEEVVFNNIPSHALYLLFNHSRDKDAPKRIFTYENGKQVWW